MAVTYPPAVPTISGDVETINRFLQSPTLLSRRLRTLAEQRFIADTLLAGRYQLQGGAILYEQSEGIYSDRTVEAVAAGSEYPLSGISTGTAAIATAQKWGQDTLVTDEAIKRLNFDPVQRALVKLVNSMVAKFDAICLAAIASAVTQTAAATAAWAPGTASTNPAYDVAKAVATIRALNQGYDPDTVVVDDLHYAQLMNNLTVLTAMRREDPSNPVYSGQLEMLQGLRILVSPNLPTASTALVLDSAMLGGIAEENLGGPGYGGQVKGVQGKSIRDDREDRWRLRARRIAVPVIVEPNSAFVITGI